MKSKNGLTKPCRFEGLYFKQQGQHGAVAFIPALHTDKKGKQSATLQILTDTGSYLTTLWQKYAARLRYHGDILPYAGTAMPAWHIQSVPPGKRERYN